MCCGIIPILRKAVIHQDKKVIKHLTLLSISYILILSIQKKIKYSFFCVLNNPSVSEACTLICLLVAVRISREHLLIHDIENCPRLNIIVAEAMIEGNATHAWLIKERLISHPYLSTEEALKYGGKSLNILKEWVRSMPVIFKTNYTWYLIKQILIVPAIHFYLNK